MLKVGVWVYACMHACVRVIIGYLHGPGILERAPGWRERFKCLNQSSSCHRHITRILKSLGELNYEYFKVSSTITASQVMGSLRMSEKLIQQTPQP